MFLKSKLRSSEQFKDIFIAEDLTPMRAKLLNYIKDECKNDFVLCHTINGKIRMKKSAVKANLMWILIFPNLDTYHCYSILTLAIQ